MNFRVSSRLVAPLALVGAYGSAYAIPLTPGSTVTFAGGITDASRTDSIFIDEFRDFTGKDAFGNTRFFGRLYIRVGREAGGTLNFYYQIANAVGSPDPIERLSTTDFSTFATDVNYFTDMAAGAGVGSVKPHRGTRTSGDGRIVRFNFDDVISGGAGYVTPGAASNWMVIKTNARNYGVATTQLINGGVATVDTYSPTTAPVPEPVTLALGASGLAVAWRRRRSRLA